jgi:hypothetical protein
MRFLYDSAQGLPRLLQICRPARLAKICRPALRAAVAGTARPRSGCVQAPQRAARNPAPSRQSSRIRPAGARHRPGASRRMSSRYRDPRLSPRPLETRLCSCYVRYARLFLTVGFTGSTRLRPALPARGTDRKNRSTSAPLIERILFIGQLRNFRRRSAMVRPDSCRFRDPDREGGFHRPRRLPTKCRSVPSAVKVPTIFFP